MRVIINLDKSAQWHLQFLVTFDSPVEVLNMVERIYTHSEYTTKFQHFLNELEEEKLTESSVSTEWYKGHRNTMLFISFWPCYKNGKSWHLMPKDELFGLMKRIEKYLYPDSYISNNSVYSIAYTSKEDILEL